MSVFFFKTLFFIAWEFIALRKFVFVMESNVQVLIIKKIKFTNIMFFRSQPKKNFFVLKDHKKAIQKKKTIIFIKIIKIHTYNLD